MANYATLKAAIQNVVKTNGNNEITGALLQQTLFAMVNSLGVGYQYVGIATPATDPGTPDQNVFYIASTAGTYVNFGGLVLALGEIAILKYNGAWSKNSTGIASKSDISLLGQEFVLSSDSYFDGNTIHIGTLYRLNKDGSRIAHTLVLNQDYVASGVGAILVYDGINDMVTWRSQRDVLPTDDVLLWASGTSYGVSQHFNFAGKLGTSSLYDILLKRIGIKERTINCSLIGETLLRTTGLIYGACDGAQKRFFTTPRFLKINKEAGEKVVSVLCESTENYYIYQYDKNFGFLQRLQNSVELHKDTQFVKIVVGLKSGNNYTFSQRELSIVANLKDEPQWVYNVAEPRQDGNYMFRTYEITNPIIPDNTVSPTENYQGNTTRIMNRGYICLPLNYNPFGKPSKVVIYCNGTSGYNFDQDSLPYNNSLVKFLAKCGYAVIGCSTRSELYKDTSQQGGADGDLVHPLSFSCYENLWKYMCEEFNIDRTGAHIFGLSSGGMMTILLSQMKTIPIKSAASLAGSVDMFSNMRICGGGLNEFWFNMLAMSYPNLPTGLSSNGRMQVVDAAVKTFVLNNLEKFIGVNPFWFNGDLPVSSFIEQYFNTINYTAQLEANTNLVSIVNSAKINLSIPFKIWHAIDDVNVPIAMSRFYRKMVLNGGGLCYLREFPANCGAHHAVGVDTDPGNYPVMDYETPFGETINVAVAWGELVDWFNRW